MKWRWLNGITLARSSEEREFDLHSLSGDGKMSSRADGRLLLLLLKKKRENAAAISKRINELITRNNIDTFERFKRRCRELRAEANQLRGDSSR